MTAVALRPRRGKTTPQEVPDEPIAEPLPAAFRHHRFDNMVIPRSVAADTALAANARDGYGNWRWITRLGDAAPDLPTPDFGEPGDYNARMVYWTANNKDKTADDEQSFLNPRFELRTDELAFLRHLIYVDKIMGQQK